MRATKRGSLAKSEYADAVIRTQRVGTVARALADVESAILREAVRARKLTIVRRALIDLDSGE